MTDPRLDPMHYKYPKTIYTYPTLTIPARELRRGDRFDSSTLQISSNGRRVRGYDEKGVLVLDFAPNDPITIQRPQPSEESVAADMRVSRNRNIAERLASGDAAQKLRKVRQRVNSDLDEYSFADYQRIEELLFAQEEYRLEMRFREAVKFDLEDRKDVDLVDIIEEFAGHLRDNLARSHRHRVARTSTSRVESLVYQIANEVEASFIENIRWYG